jgi:CxxC-x17-CxxC domain-containing protein
MGQFRRENRSFGGSKRFGGDRETKTMHRATCSDCGRSCEVPFRPTGDKPVYCSECFGQQRDNGYDDRDFGRDRHSSFDRPRFEDKKMFSASCDSCGSRCEVPFRPTSGKPVFCNACFGKSSATAGKAGGSCNCKDQFTAINTKLDTIIKALNIPATPKVFNDEIEELIEEIAQAEAPVKKTRAKAEPKAKKTSKK